MRWDITAIVGLALSAAGIYLIHPPLSMIVVGIVSVLIGIRGYRRDSR